MQGMQEQGGGEIDRLKIRVESGTDFLIIWALSVAIDVYVAMSLCVAAEISCYFME